MNCYIRNFALCVAMLFGMVAVLCAQPASEIVWLHDMKIAQKNAKESGKFMLVKAGATWCGPCKQMTALTWSDAVVIKKTQPYIMVALDQQLNPQDIEDLAVTAYPTIVVLSPESKEITRSIGYLNAVDMEKFLEAVAVVHHTEDIKKPTPTPKSKATTTTKPTAKPTSKPTIKPTTKPTIKPTTKPTIKPTTKPTAKPTAKPVQSDYPPRTGGQDAPAATVSDSYDPLAVIDMLEAAGGLRKPAKTPTPQPTTKPTAKPTAKPSATPTAKAEPESTPVPTPEAGDVDVERIKTQYKEALQRNKDGYGPAARALCAEIVREDPKNKSGVADMAYIMFTSLTVSRNDAVLRRQAYARICEFDARYPGSPNRDYYTIVRAAMAQDLGKNDEAIRLLRDFPTSFPNSKRMSLARDAWDKLTKQPLPTDKDPMEKTQPAKTPTNSKQTATPKSTKPTAKPTAKTTPKTTGIYQPPAATPVPTPTPKQGMLRRIFNP